MFRKFLNSKAFGVICIVYGLISLDAALAITPFGDYLSGVQNEVYSICLQLISEVGFPEGQCSWYLITELAIFRIVAIFSLLFGLMCIVTKRPTPPKNEAM
ncbi:hypothetical protein J4N45_09815 [Vibrio sp. SCSIO 43140]|uniref:hypothetical protein n=1 Tax=Vibrio sp. SCSIO 43140 TaxID=2819100 RepID=UPI0020750696|nr:hypothetical protein [Vibrio sp. SCSIO 43140]USD58824.1 hypothetical protein J4N45_09815 [Vibrio sp. SCSIO 43140]